MSQVLVNVRVFDLFDSFFFFNDTATTEIYTLSLHDALPISRGVRPARRHRPGRSPHHRPGRHHPGRSEEHTSELQSRQYLVCRLLLEKKKTNTQIPPPVNKKKQKDQI